ncbi:OmpA family protein [Verrucomicrobiaceae bacterium 227]
MAENQDPQTTPESNPSATPSSNQNLILGIVMGAVVLLLLLLVINQQFNKDDSGKEDQDLIAAKKQLEKIEATNESMRFAAGANNGQSATVLAEAIKRDTQTLAGLVNASAANAAELRAANQALLDSQSSNRNLQGQLAQYQNAASRVPGLESQIADLQKRLAGAVDKLTADSIRDELSRVKLERDKLLAEIAQLKQEAASMVDGNVYALLKADKDALQSQYNECRAELQRLRAQIDASKLFVTSDRLSPKALDLFRELERLEGTDRATLEQAYVRIEKEFNARPVEAAHFATGSSDLAAEHETHLKEITAQSPGNSFFLVVGYASGSGDSKQNETLSSKRATRVASVVNYLKQKGQEVQAVYLGETDRFDASRDAPNQVCEVWEIRP